MAILQPGRVRIILNADRNASTLGNADRNISIINEQEYDRGLLI